MRTLCTLLFVVALNAAFAQGEVTGIVTDSLNRPVAGVNIVLKGTPNGTVSNTEGQFSISLPAGKIVLLFAFIGYKSYEQEMTVRKNCVYHLEVVMMEYEKKKKFKSHGKVVRTECPTTN